jgi:hypothetical protein
MEKGWKGGGNEWGVGWCFLVSEVEDMVATLDDPAHKTHHTYYGFCKPSCNPASCPLSVSVAIVRLHTFTTYCMISCCWSWPSCYCLSNYWGAFLLRI